MLVLAGSVAAQPRFVAPVHSFGDVYEGTEAVHSFGYVNAGSEALRIEGVEADCGCTVTEWTEEPVAPGDSGRVVVTLDATNLDGLISKRIRVQMSSEPVPVVLTVEANVVPRPLEAEHAFGPLTFEASGHDFGLVSKPTPWVFRVRNDGPSPIRLLRARAPKGLSLSYPGRPIRSGELVTLRAFADGRCGPAGETEWAGEIVLRTSSSEAPEIRLPVQGERCVESQ